MDPQFVRAHEPWCFTTSSTPGKRDREAAIYQCELVSDALLALQTIPQTDALQYVLLTIRQILDDGDKYKHSTNSLTFCEGLGFSCQLRLAGSHNLRVDELQTTSN